MAIYYSFIAYLKRRNYFLQILLLFSFLFLAVVPVGFIEVLFGPFEYPDNGPANTTALAVLIVAPLLETFLFQLVVCSALLRVSFFKNRPALIIIISAVVFASSHTYDIMYVIAAFWAGLVLAFSYIFYLPQKQRAFWTTCLLHFLRNLVPFILTLK